MYAFNIHWMCVCTFVRMPMALVVITLSPADILKLTSRQHVHMLNSSSRFEVTPRVTFLTVVCS
jgi:hypothetical protein